MAPTKLNLWSLAYRNFGKLSTVDQRLRLAQGIQQRSERYRSFKSLASKRQHHAPNQVTQIPASDSVRIESIKYPARPQATAFVNRIQPSLNGESLTVGFHDGAYTFHSQWIHDTLVTDASTKEASEAIGQQSTSQQILAAKSVGGGFETMLEVVWNTGQISRFPAPWLRVYAPLVARPEIVSPTTGLNLQAGWLADTLEMPTFTWSQIFHQDPTSDTAMEIRNRIYDILLHDNGCAIMKIVDLPTPNAQNERDGNNTLNTQILRHLFGSVFIHPRRGGDKTFNIASHHAADVKKGDILPNYNTDKVCLTHTDQSFYMIQSRVNSLYALEGESLNTFVSCEAALRTLMQEDPDLVEPLCTAPIAIGRVAKWYHPFLYQANTEPTVTLQPGFPDRIHRFRWHPHLTGSLLSSYAQYPLALAAHRKFQEILRRDSHELRVHMRPGDLYLFDNFRVLHGRERVLSWPRTNVGQSVHAQVCADTYREFKLERLMRYFEEKWLIHMPQAQLNQLEDMVEAWHQ